MPLLAQPQLEFAALGYLDRVKYIRDLFEIHDTQITEEIAPVIKDMHAPCILCSSRAKEVILIDSGFVSPERDCAHLACSSCGHVLLLNLSVMIKNRA